MVDTTGRFIPQHNWLPIELGYWVCECGGRNPMSAKECLYKWCDQRKEKKDDTV